MTIVEQKFTPEHSVNPESKWIKTGSIVAITTFDIPQDPAVFAIVHQADSNKHIVQGMVGLPSETIKDDQNETPDEARARTLREEVGIIVPEDVGLTLVSTQEMLHPFNGLTGLNGDSSDTLGYIYVYQAADPRLIMREFERGWNEGRVDRKEVFTGGFFRRSDLFHERHRFGVRPAPDPRRIMKEVQVAGYF